MLTLYPGSNGSKNRLAQDQATMSQMLIFEIFWRSPQPKLKIWPLILNLRFVRRYLKIVIYFGSTTAVRSWIIRASEPIQTVRMMAAHLGNRRFVFIGNPCAEVP